MIRVHSYESMGTFDGPGLRLVVFLQGCNFRCLYCANPDTIDTKGESTETAIDEIVHMAVSQKAFFGKKGGVTFSGGEPTLQAKALIFSFSYISHSYAYGTYTHSKYTDKISSTLCLCISQYNRYHKKHCMNNNKQK